MRYLIPLVVTVAAVLIGWAFGPAGALVLATFGILFGLAVVGPQINRI